MDLIYDLQNILSKLDDAFQKERKLCLYDLPHDHDLLRLILDTTKQVNELYEYILIKNHQSSPQD